MPLPIFSPVVHDQTMTLLHPLVLASSSPRRKQILEDAGLGVTVFPIQVSESLNKNLNVRDQIMDIAFRKWTEAEKLLTPQSFNRSIVLTADTMVVFKGEALGKPENESEAIETLLELSGHEHQVMTAFCVELHGSPRPHQEIVESRVTFRLISRQEATDYVATKEPLDKAGSYAIQGQGRKFVQSWDGSFANIVGLPIERLLEVFHQKRWTR